jgi:hypothetical protein
VRYGVGMNVILFLLASAGATLILVHGKVFAWWRDAIEAAGLKTWLPFHCSMCLGFWVGVNFWVAFDLSGWPLPGPGCLVAAFAYGCASSVVSYTFGSLVGDAGLRVSGR